MGQQLNVGRRISASIADASVEIVAIHYSSSVVVALEMEHAAYYEFDVMELEHFVELEANVANKNSVDLQEYLEVLDHRHAVSTVEIVALAARGLILSCCDSFA